jgi:hypothetical protein
MFASSCAPIKERLFLSRDRYENTNATISWFKSFAPINVFLIPSCGVHRELEQ